MKISKRQLRRLIWEALDVRDPAAIKRYQELKKGQQPPELDDEDVRDPAARKRYEEFKKSLQPPELDDQFLRSFEDAEGRLDPKQFDVADKHYDDAIARSKGYEDADDMYNQEWMADIDDRNAAMERRNAKVRREVGIDNPNFNVEYYSKFNTYRGQAKTALEKGNEKEFQKNYDMMRRFGSMMYGYEGSENERWKSEDDVPALMQANDEINAGGMANFLNLKRSPTLKALGIFEE